MVEQEGCQEKFKQAWRAQWTPAILEMTKADRMKITEWDELAGVDEMPEVV